MNMIDNINGLSLLVNDQEYPRNTTYVTLGILGGMCTKRIYKRNEEKVLDIHPSSVLIYCKIIKVIMKNKYKIRTKTQVNRNNITLTLKTNSSKFDCELEKLLSTVFDREYLKEDLFLSAKNEIEQEFTENYQNIEFRAKYKMLEFSDSNKEFNFIDFAESIRGIKFNDFKQYIKNFISLKNCFLFINGKPSYEKSTSVEYLLNYEEKKEKVEIVYKAHNLYLKEDMHLIEEANESYKLGCIRVDFLNSNCKLEDRYLLLNLIGWSLFDVEMGVNIDYFDSSIIYNQSPMSEYKFEIMKLVNDDCLDKLKEKISQMIFGLVEKKPYIFNNFIVDNVMNDLDVFLLLNNLKDLSIEKVIKIIQNGEIKITEAHLIYKELQLSYE